MNIGKNIKKIREDNSLSQEQFGKIFFVTRQTVSNWENEKSCPDLNTIIKISDEFSISLDKLLKEDPEMVNTISEAAVSGIKWKMPRRIIILAACILVGCAVIAASLWGAVWHSRKVKLERNFNDTSAELGFGETEDGVLRMREDGVVYTLPNQKMPSYWDFSLNFHADMVYGEFKQENYVYTVIYCGDSATLHIKNKENMEDYFIDMTADGTFEKSLSGKEQQAVSPAADKTAEVLAVCRQVYDKVYI